MCVCFGVQFPFETFTLFDRAPSVLSNQLLRMFRLMRLVRITRFSKLLRRLEAYEDEVVLLNPNLIRMVKIFSILIFVAHIDACIWFYYGSLSEPSWITRYCPGDKCLPDMSLSQKYLASLYWTITTMMTVGYGDITPTLSNPEEIIIAICTQIIGAITISYLIGTMLNLITYYNPAESRRINEGSILSEYIKILKLRSRGTDVQSVLRAVSLNFIFNLDVKSVFPENDILYSLPPFLRQSTVLFLFHRVIPRLPSLCRVEHEYPHALSVIIPLLRPARYRTNGVVYSPDMFSRDMLFLYMGAIEFRRNGVTVGTLNSGQTFGAVSTLSPPSPAGWSPGSCAPVTHPMPGAPERGG
jgi:hypothetical protein